jgi:phosphonate transport system substrate-binding protein
MARRSNSFKDFVTALFVCGSLIASAQAQECPRGELDKAYCDGDLIADAPTDPKQFVNPSTLIFSYTPVEYPAVYTKVWDGFVKHLEQITGKKVVFFPVQSNAGF